MDKTKEYIIVPKGLKKKLYDMLFYMLPVLTELYSYLLKPVNGGDGEIPLGVTGTGPTAIEEKERKEKEIEEKVEEKKEKKHCCKVYKQTQKFHTLRCGVCPENSFCSVKDCDRQAMVSFDGMPRCCSECPQKHELSCQRRSFPSCARYCCRRSFVATEKEGELLCCALCDGTHNLLKHTKSCTQRYYRGAGRRKPQSGRCFIEDDRCNHQIDRTTLMKKGKLRSKGAVEARWGKIPLILLTALFSFWETNAEIVLTDALPSVYMKGEKVFVREPDEWTTALSDCGNITFGFHAGEKKLYVNDRAVRMTTGSVTAHYVFPCMKNARALVEKYKVKCELVDQIRDSCSEDRFCVSRGPYTSGCVSCTDVTYKRTVRSCMECLVENDCCSVAYDLHTRVLNALSDEVYMANKILSKEPGFIEKTYNDWTTPLDVPVHLGVFSCDGKIVGTVTPLVYKRHLFFLTAAHVVTANMCSKNGMSVLFGDKSAKVLKHKIPSSMTDLALLKVQKHVISHGVRYVRSIAGRKPKAVGIAISPTSKLTPTITELDLDRRSSGIRLFATGIARGMSGGYIRGEDSGTHHLIVGDGGTGFDYAMGWIRSTKNARVRVALIKEDYLKKNMHYSKKIKRSGNDFFDDFELTFDPSLGDEGGDDDDIEEGFDKEEEPAHQPTKKKTKKKRRKKEDEEEQEEEDSAEEWEPPKRSKYPSRSKRRVEKDSVEIVEDTVKNIAEKLSKIPKRRSDEYHTLLDEVQKDYELLKSVVEKSNEVIRHKSYSLMFPTSEKNAVMAALGSKPTLEQILVISDMLSNTKTAYPVQVLLGVGKDSQCIASSEKGSLSWENVVFPLTTIITRCSF